MDLDKVIYGRTKDGIERCFEKRYRTYITDTDIVPVTVYVDLKTKEKFLSSFIDLSTLKPITYIVGEKYDKMWKRKVIKTYNVDRSSLIDVKNVVFGNLINKCCNLDEDSGVYLDEVLEENKLFLRIEDRDDRVRDIDTNTDYTIREKVASGVSVKVLKSINCDQFESFQQTKGKLLELNYNRKLF